MDKEYLPTPPSYPTQSRVFHLDRPFTIRIPYPIDSIMIEYFDGKVGTVFLRIGTLDISRERITVGKAWRWSTHQYPVYLINTTYQVGKIMRVTFGGEGSAVVTPPITQVNVLDQQSNVVNPAEDETVDSIKGTGDNQKTLYDIWSLLEGGITVSADVIVADIESITGSGTNAKTLYDLYTKLNDQLDITASALRDAIRGTAPNANTLYDIYSKLNTQLDITASALRDAIRGTPNSSTLYDIYSKLNAQLNITLSALRDALKGSYGKDFSSLEADVESISGKLGNTSGLYSCQLSVSTSRVVFPSVTVKQGCEACVKACDDNSAPIYVGSSSVTTSSGFRLNPGQSICLRVDNLSRIYAISGSSGQKAYAICET